MEIHTTMITKNYLLTDNNITLKWYEQLEHWNETIKQVSRNGKILKLIRPMLKLSIILLEMKVTRIF